MPSGDNNLLQLQDIINIFSPGHGKTVQMC